MNGHTIETARRRVALFGGAFNPPHLAHLFTVQYLLSREDVDEVWIMPSAKHAFGKEMAPFNVRVKMLRECFSTMQGVLICLIENERTLSGKTFDTLVTLSERSPELEFSLVIGADNLTESHRWYRFDDLVSRWRVIALGRPGHETALMKARIHPWCSVGPTLPNISSSEIRRALALLSPEVRLRLQEGQGLDAVPHKYYEVLSWLPERCIQIVSENYQGTERSISCVQSRSVDVCIWGRGKAGRAIDIALNRSGIHAASVSMRAARRWLDQNPTEIPDKTFLHAIQGKTWIIAAKDQQLEQTSRLLAECRRRWQDTGLLVGGDIALHCAGSKGPEALTSLTTSGISVAQWHPLQTLRGEESARDLRGVAFLIGGDEKAMQEGQRLARAAGGWALRMPSVFSHVEENERLQARALYHCAAVLASNLTLGLFGAAVELFVSLGWQHHEATHALAPLTRVTLERGWQLPQNELENKGLQEGLTGPLSRGDLEVLKRHMEALKEFRGQASHELEHAYRALSRWVDYWLRGEASILSEED